MGAAEYGEMAESRERRKWMVSEQIEARGVVQPAVLAAMRAVPRELFVPPSDRHRAYEDTPLPIPAGQTISQPYVVAYMISVIDPRPGDRALEIGAGSGYAAAVLAQVVAEVYTVERHPELVEYAQASLAEAGVGNVHVQEGDGTLGWPEYAPYDGIIVTAGGPIIPATLKQQLSVGGCLVMPVGRSRHHQHLVLLTRQDEDHYREDKLSPVAFVPLIGHEGW